MIKLMIDSPAPFQEVEVNCLIQGKVSLRCLQNEDDIDPRLFVEVYDMKGHSFMGFSIDVDCTAVETDTPPDYLVFESIFKIHTVSVGWLQKSNGRIVFRISPSSCKDSIFLPIIVKQFHCQEGKVGDVVKHKNIGKMILKYEKDIDAYYRELACIEKLKFDKHPESTDGYKSVIFGEPYMLSCIYSLLQQGRINYGGYPYKKEEEKERRLHQRYKKALIWRGPLCGDVVGRQNGFEFRVWSNDHDMHFHVIHKGRGINARFSFPEIKLINYKSKGNYIGSKEQKSIQEYFKDEDNFNALKRVFTKRHQ